MKNKLTIILAVLAAMAMLAGCGQAKDTTALKDMKVEEYVTLGEYKGLEVTVPAPAVDETELEDTMMQTFIDYFPAEMGVTDRGIVEGDTANIDYVGKKNDVAFEGGTAAGSNLTIGSDSFIDGFEDGLVGVKAGETVDLNLTFPENYRNADLAGAEVVFTVTVNYIIPAERKDEAIAALGFEGVTNEEEFRQFAYDYLYDAAEENRLAEVQNAVVEAFLANCSFSKIPEDMIKEYKGTIEANIKKTASAYGVDGDTFTSVFYGMDLETFVNTHAENNAKQNIAMQAVANKEGLNMSDEDLDAQLLAEAQAAGVATIEEYIGDASKEDFREYFMYVDVLTLLVDNAVVSE